MDNIISYRYLQNTQFAFFIYAHGTIIEFEYDEAKSRSNLEKHGIDFEEAQGLWLDEHLISMNVEHKGEKRNMAVAHYAGSYWAAIYTERDGKVRLISVRRATMTERKLYDKAY